MLHEVSACIISISKGHQRFLSCLAKRTSHLALFSMVICFCYPKPKKIRGPGPNKRPSLKARLLPFFHSKGGLRASDVEKAVRIVFLDLTSRSRLQPYLFKDEGLKEL